jgi:hypothetical protein
MSREDRFAVLNFAPANILLDHFNLQLKEALDLGQDTRLLLGQSKPGGWCNIRSDLELADALLSNRPTFQVRLCFSVAVSMFSSSPGNVVSVQSSLHPQHDHDECTNSMGILE